MRTLVTPQQEPTGYLDEVSALLVDVPYPHIKPSRPRDTGYGLLTAIVEVEAWLEAGPNDAQSPRDRHSFAGDVTRALSQPGPLVSSRLPAADGLAAALQTVASAGSRADREPVRTRLAALQAELADPETAIAAFDDLLERCAIPPTPTCSSPPG